MTDRTNVDELGVSGGKDNTEVKQSFETRNESIFSFTKQSRDNKMTGEQGQETKLQQASRREIRKETAPSLT